MYQPLVSVIVPIYNVEEYLPQCLDSIISQVYQNIEILCVNDGATDNSTVILENYLQKDSRIKVVNQKNQGLSAARNTGLQHASGELIVFVDSDDWIENDLIEKVCRTFSNEDVDFVCYGSYKFIEGCRKKTYAYKYPSDCIFSVDDPKLMTVGVSTWGKMYRTRFLKQNKLLFPVGLYYEDVYFHWGCISFAKNIHLLEGVYYNYRVRDDSIMGRSKKRKKGMAVHHLYELNKIHQLWKENGFLESHRNLFLFLCDEYIREGYKYLNDDEKDEYIAKTKDFVSAWDFKPQKWTLTYDLVTGNKISPNKYRWARSIRKRLTNLKNLLKFES